MDYNIHEEYMNRALALAKKGLGKVSPNPMVGCVIVKKGRIIGEGYHSFYGGNHAEKEAFSNCSEDPSEASLYVSLEPCTHYGKTPPCINSILENGIRDVYIAMKDPNPMVGGKGISALKQAGINVECGILMKDASELNKGYSNWVTNGVPFVIGKIAEDSKGYIGQKGKRVLISGNQALEDVHKLRANVDAIMIGKNTALIDNPSLTVRKVIGKNPKRIVLDTNRTLPLSLKIFNDSLSETIVLCSNKIFKDNKTSHCKYIAVDEINGHLDPKDILLKLGAIGITSLMIEGGGLLMKSFLENELIDQFYLYSADSFKNDLNIKNPFNIDDRWEMAEKKILGRNQLFILNKKKVCLQEL